MEEKVGGCGNITKVATSSGRRRKVGVQEGTRQDLVDLRLLHVYVSPVQIKQKETGMVDTSMW